jgi:predicted MFS family arabinose efflux permease
MRRLLALSCAVILVDTIFFTALTPLLPHYAHSLHLGKTGAGVLFAAYPAGCFVGAIPSGLAAGRLGAKTTVLLGVLTAAGCIFVFGLAGAAWQLDAARFVQGVASAFSWTGALVWLVSEAPPERRGSVIGAAFGAAAAGALVGPLVGGIASVAGTAATFVTLAVLSLGVAAWAAVTPAQQPGELQPLAHLLRVLRHGDVVLAAWFTLLPGLLFGSLSVLAPLRLSDLGMGAVAISGVFLVAAAVETFSNTLLGRVADRQGPVVPLLWGLVASIAVAALLPWPDGRVVLAVLVVAAGPSFAAFFTPGMTLLTQVTEQRGLSLAYAFTLVSLAWAPGEAVGAAGAGALAGATSDTLPYLILAATCALTLAALWRRRSSIVAAPSAGTA